MFCDGLSTFEVYIAAFTWSLMVITGTGGTDFYPSHKSFAETIVVICLLFTGAILWTQILADFLTWPPMATLRVSSFSRPLMI